MKMGEETNGDSQPNPRQNKLVVASQGICFTATSFKQETWSVCQMVDVKSPETNETDPKTDCYVKCQWRQTTLT
jgi:hypothetical protein